MARPTDARDQTAWLGHPHPRVEGGAKVTGRAAYASDRHLPGLAHAALVTSTIRAGGSPVSTSRRPRPSRAACASSPTGFRRRDRR